MVNTINTKVTYKNYALMQQNVRRYRIKYEHIFYKNNKRIDCISIINPIGRKTKKQLFHYLQYLVNHNIITKFDKTIIDPNGNQHVPAVFDESKNSIEYTFIAKPKTNVLDEEFEIFEIVEEDEFTSDDTSSDF